tara:strand:+ start:375 stop:620 length:246 start_codon:yes stop_codon:yes gene_type:complete
MKEAERVADEIMCKYVRLTHYCEINTKQCSLNHVEGIIKDNENTLRWLSNIKALEKTIHGLSRNIDFYQEVKTIIEKQITN